MSINQATFHPLPTTEANWEFFRILTSYSFPGLVTSKQELHILGGESLDPPKNVVTKKL